MSQIVRNTNRYFEIEFAGELPAGVVAPRACVELDDDWQWSWGDDAQETTAIIAELEIREPESTADDDLGVGDPAASLAARETPGVTVQVQDHAEEHDGFRGSQPLSDLDRAFGMTHTSIPEARTSGSPIGTVEVLPIQPTDHGSVFIPTDWELPPTPPTISYGAHDLEGLMGQLNGDGDRWGEAGDAVHLRIAFPQLYSEFPLGLLERDNLLNEDGELDALYAIFERGLRVFDDDMIRDTLEAIRSWTEHTASVTFELVGPSDEADIYFYGVSRESGSGAHGSASVVRADGSSATVSRVVLDTDDGFPSTHPGSSGFTTLLHEVGHALGLSHPGHYNASDDVRPTYLRDAEYIEDTEQYTVMSYFGEQWTGADYNGGSEQSLRTHDILAIQEIYGINWDLRSGDTRYGYNASNGIPSVFDFSNLGENGHPTAPIITIFDGNGIDTLDLRYDGSDLVLDLRPGAFSSTHGLTHNISLAHRTLNGITSDLQGYIENAVGGSGNDLIIGNVQENSLVGNVGNDTLSGGEGQDAYFGGVGTDTLDFSEESNAFEVHLSSTHDNPGIIEGHANSSDGHEVVRDVENVWLGSANDTITGSSKGNELSGGGGRDLIRGLGGNDRLEGGDGKDTLEGGNGNDLMYGLSGNDEMSGDSGNDSLYGGIGNDDLGGGNGNDFLNGQDGKDTLDGGLGTDTVSGGDGDDVIFASVGLDDLDGGHGVDTLDYTNIPIGNYAINLSFNTAYRNGVAADLISGFENVVTTTGDDVLRGSNSANRLDSGSGDDSLSGLNGGDVLLAGRGNDTLNGGNGNDVLDGGNGNDTASYVDQFSGVRVDLGLETQQTVGAGVDTLLSIENVMGSSHDDWLIGNDGGNRLEGRSGHDQMFGGNGGDVLDGGNGNDNMFGGAGNDIMIGGEGSDWASYLFESSGVWVNLNSTGQQNTRGSGWDTLISVENLAGSTHADLLTGSSGNNYIDGHGGSDIISAGDGSDVIDGGAGDDAISGGLGNDIIDGGAGSDWALYSIGLSSGVSIDLGAGTQNTGGGGVDTLISIEHVTGTRYADSLTGTAIANQLLGNGGDDWMWGNGGADTVNGGTGEDAISGGSGADLMIGGFGNDHQWGGTGSDTFGFDDNWGNDWIWDFEAGVDVLDFGDVKGLDDVIALSVQDTPDGTSIHYGGNSVLLIGVSQSALSDSDFLF